MIFLEFLMNYSTKSSFHSTSKNIVSDECAIKFKNDPLFMLFLLIGSQAVLKGYPSVSDYVLFFGLLMTQFKFFEHTRSFFSPYSLPLEFSYLNYKFGGFNLNFYYISTLIWNVVLVIIILDTLSAYGINY